MVTAISQDLGSFGALCPRKPFFPWLWWAVLGHRGVSPRDLRASAIAQGGVCECVGRGVAFPRTWLKLLFPPVVDGS